MSSRVSKVAPAVAALIAALIGLAAGAAQAADAMPRTVYVSASHLNMRAQPAPDAELLTRWRINQPLLLTSHAGPRWCGVEATPAPLDPALRQGYVDCSYLTERPVRFADIEAEAANLILALNRLAAAGATPAAYTALPWAQAFAAHPTQAQQLLDALFDQMDRHFALSPSMRTYADYNALLASLAALATPDHPLPEPIASLIGKRLAVLPGMRAAFTADFAAQPSAPVRRSITASLSALIDARQAGLVDDAPPAAGPPSAAHGDPAGAFDLAAPPPRGSFFSDGRWAIGWAPLLTQADDTARGEAVYRFHYTGSGPWAVGDTIEMAKALRATVRTSFRYLKSDGSASDDLAQMRGTADGAFEASAVQVSLPAWAITDDGLVRGRLRKVVFAGDACSNGAGDTAAEFVFAKPLPRTVHGVFVSSAAIDPARAKVTVHKRNFLAPLLSDENTLTNETVVEVDLNGDGIADLRSRESNDTSVSSVAAPHLVSNWYADDVESLEVNEDGHWRMLSLYDVVSCT